MPFAKYYEAFSAENQATTTIMQKEEKRGEERGGGDGRKENLAMHSMQILDDKPLASHKIEVHFSSDCLYCFPFFSPAG